jgi:peptidoglycan LD-endopeptidase LytH
LLFIRWHQFLKVLDMRHFSRKFLLAQLAIVIIIFQSCSSSAPGLFAKKTPHQQYGDKISEAGLKQTALGRLWFLAAEQALSKPLMISLPYRETGYFPAEKPQSAGLAFTAKRGEKLKITLEKKPANGFLIYMDLWQRPAGNGNPKLVVTSDTTASPIEYEVDDEASFILRLQPELLKGGEYTINITTGPSLAFPVPSKAKANVGSFWGAGRDNGARRHEGIDIFAPFRTPVVAAADGYVTRVEETPIGGKVVWMRPDERPLSLYYAHLDSQLAQPGQNVRIGDTLGLIGNTGNARTTAPHLHFGIYAIGGPVDPFPFVNPSVKEPATVTASLTSLGKNVRTESKARIYEEADAKAKTLGQFDAQTMLSVKAATKNWYKVVLPSGEEGFLPGSQVTLINSPVKKATLKTIAPVLDQPDSMAAHKTLVQAGKTVSILAAYGNFYYVDAGAVEGWMLKTGL